MLPGVGVFGTGSITKMLVCLLREKGFEVKAIWVERKSEAEEIKEIAGFHEIEVHTRIDDVLLRKDVDLVFVMCQPFLHAEIAVKALGIGKHVFCEAPMGLYLDALKMVRAAQYYPTLISLVNHSLRFLPAFIQMRRCLEEELIGEISLVDIRVQIDNSALFPQKFDWMCDAAMGGGALTLVGGHIVDLVSFLLQQRALRVHGIIKAYTKTTSTIKGIRQITAPDFCNFQMELANGVLVTTSLHCLTMASKFCQEVLICGNKGHLVVRGSDLFVFKNKVETQQPKEEAIYVDIQDPASRSSSAESLLPQPYIRGLNKMIGALKEAFAGKELWVREPVKTAATFEDGLYVQAVLDALRKSSETKVWQRVQITRDTPSNHDQIMRFARMSTM